jgi:hypothetical protein
MRDLVAFAQPLQAIARILYAIKSRQLSSTSFPTKFVSRRRDHIHEFRIYFQETKKNCPSPNYIIFLILLK